MGTDGPGGRGPGGGPRGSPRPGPLSRGGAFFRSLVETLERPWEKSSLETAAGSPDRVGDVGLYEPIRAEHERTVRGVLRLTGTEALLDRDPTLQRSIRLRNPYVDPMSLLQIDLLSRWRATEREDDALLSALLTTVHGIAQGLQNTG